jgi:L-ribulokinase
MPHQSGTPTFSLGLDFGSSSVRALIADTQSGQEVGSGTGHYPSGEEGIITAAGDPHLARQHPCDYEEALEAAMRDAVSNARKQHGFSPDRIAGVGVDATASTPLAVDSELGPLVERAELASDPGALAWLWKDHTAHAEAEEVTRLAQSRLPSVIARLGGVYSSEWYLAKLLRLVRQHPRVLAQAAGWVELGDYIVGRLIDCRSPRLLPRGVCAAGHKGFYHETHGFPPPDFLRSLDPKLAAWWERAPPQRPQASTVPAGRLSAEWASRLGLPAGVPVATAAIDAHMGAVGAGVRPGRLVKVLGTSGCDLFVHPAGGGEAPVVPGLCGTVLDSIIPGCWGLEAGQAAVGDLFGWFVRELGGASSHADLTERASRLLAGESGLVALDWNNGNRSLLADPLLTGCLVGQTLRTKPHEVYRALIEATAFGARVILDAVSSGGIRVDEVVACGGIAEKNPFLLQLYADVLRRPLALAGSRETCALGAAMCGAVAAGREAGGHATIEAAQTAMAAPAGSAFQPREDSAAVYDQLYALYRSLHDAFGRPRVEGPCDLRHVMKELLALQSRQRTPRS